MFRWRFGLVTLTDSLESGNRFASFPLLVDTPCLSEQVGGLSTVFEDYSLVCASEIKSAEHEQWIYAGVLESTEVFVHMIQKSERLSAENWDERLTHSPEQQRTDVVIAIYPNSSVLNLLKRERGDEALTDRPLLESKRAGAHAAGIERR